MVTAFEQAKRSVYLLALDEPQEVAPQAFIFRFDSDDAGHLQDSPENFMNALILISKSLPNAVQCINASGGPNSGMKFTLNSKTFPRNQMLHHLDALQAELGVGWHALEDDSYHKHDATGELMLGLLETSTLYSRGEHYDRLLKTPAGIQRESHLIRQHAAAMDEQNWEQVETLGIALNGKAVGIALTKEQLIESSKRIGFQNPLDNSPTR